MLSFLKNVFVLHGTITVCFKSQTTHKISTLQEKQEGGSVLRETNALRGRISASYFGYSFRL